MNETPLEALSEALHNTAPHNHNIGEGYPRAICHYVSSHTNRAAAILAALKEEGGWELVKIIPKSMPFTGIYPPGTK